MRLESIVALGLLACGIAVAAESRNATYVVGNLDGIETGAQGILSMEKAGFKFQSGKATIEVPYAKLIVAELGPTLTHSSGVPLYKIWELHKRFLVDRPTYQNVTIIYRDPDGNQLSMTLEMLEAAAAQTYDTIQTRTGQKQSASQQQWWGDSYWRTTRTNADWNQKVADEQPIKPDTAKPDAK